MKKIVGYITMNLSSIAVDFSLFDFFNLRCAPPFILFTYVTGMQFLFFLYALVYLCLSVVNTKKRERERKQKKNYFCAAFSNIYIYKTKHGWRY
jgi:hypothetical protein